METQDYAENHAESVEKDFMDASTDEESSLVSISEGSESESQTPDELGPSDSEEEGEEVDDPKSNTNHEFDDRIELELASQMLPERLNEASPIKFLGHVYCAPTPYSLVIQSCSTAETAPLDVGSILTLEDRSVVGKVFEIFGQVTCPFYLVRFPNPRAVAAAKARREMRLGGARVQNMDEIQLEEEQVEIVNVGPTQVDPPPLTPQARFPTGTPIWYGVEVATLVPVAKLCKLKARDEGHLDGSASEVESDVGDYALESPRQLNSHAWDPPERQPTHQPVRPSGESNPNGAHTSNEPKFGRSLKSYSDLL